MTHSPYAIIAERAIFLLSDQGSSTFGALGELNPRNPPEKLNR